jgi:chemotaxis protein CheZ
LLIKLAFILSELGTINLNRACAIPVSCEVPQQRERSVKPKTSRVAGYPVSNPMPERRKVFRIEKVTAAHADAASSGNSACSCCEEVMRELAALRAMLAAAPSRPSDSSVAESTEVRRLAARLRDIRSALIGAEHTSPDATTATASAPMSRFGSELDAAVKASEQATQKILAAAEEIDQAANNLSAAVKGNSEQGLAQDIRDRVIGIFEACNYQDVTSQRLAKVRTALAVLQNLIGDALGEVTNDTPPAVHGPPLDGDDGHASQSEVDSLFAAGIRPPSY